MVTIGIKALNEEARIAMAIESALQAVAPLGGQVVVADSGSTDRTVEIASGYPVQVVQFADIRDRSCGAGAQLAFQQAGASHFFYMLDGDMVLHPDFLRAGIEFLESHPDVAAVGGHINERHVDAEEFQIRANEMKKDRNLRPGLVERLDCGGLYRTEVVRTTGFFADRNLHAFEEFDLGARLQSLGWKLARIDHPAVDHYGHTGGGYALMWRRVRSGYAGAVGEVLRGALGRQHLPVVLRQLGHVRNGAAVLVWWALVLASAALAPILLLLLVVVPLAFLVWRRGSLRLGLFSFCYWNVSAWGLLSGLLRRRVSPHEPLRYVDRSGAPRASVVPPAR